MDYKFTKVHESYPKRSYRSKRTLKKMHLGEYASTLVEIIIDLNIFELSTADDLLNVMYMHDNGSFVHSSTDKTHIITEFSTNDFSADLVMEYINTLLYNLTNIEQEIAKLNSVTILYGDAYYGEW